MMGGSTTRNMQGSFQKKINCVTLHFVEYILEYTYDARINVKSPNNTSKWQMRFNSAFKGLNKVHCFVSRSLQLRALIKLKVVGVPVYNAI
jgi:hypothetical protein